MTVRSAPTLLSTVAAVLLALLSVAQAVAIEPAGVSSDRPFLPTQTPSIQVIGPETLNPADSPFSLDHLRADRAAAAEAVDMEPSFIARPVVVVAPPPVAPAAPSQGSPTTAPAPSNPYACSYADVLTARAGVGFWATTLVDTRFMLPGGYAPGDLVDSSAAGINGGYPLRQIVIADLAAMAADAKAAGVNVGIDSGFRSYGSQQSTFNYYVGLLGYDAALLRAARPGHSEHQLGTTIDLADHPGAYAWVAANGWRYGWVQSYPAGKTGVSCYQYEPWHYRYVGRAMAAEVVASGLTLREFIISRYGG